MDIAHWCNYTSRNTSDGNALLRSLYSAEAHRSVSAVICSVGVLANMAIVAVLVRPCMRTSVNVLLVAIALCDMSLMAMYFVYMFVPFCLMQTFGWAWYLLIYANFSVIAHSSSLWLTVIMALLRYVIVKQNFGQTVYNKTSTACWLVLITVTSVCIGCIPNLLRNRVHAVSAHSVPYCPPPSPPASSSGANLTDWLDSIAYVVDPPPWWNCNLEKMNFWFAGILFKIVPCLLLTAFMTILIQTLFTAKRRHRRLVRSMSANSLQTERTTVMLIAIVFVFLITELPQGILVVAISTDPSALNLYTNFGDVLDLLSLINSSVNFILYCSMSQQFRSQFVETFGCCWRRPFSAMPPPSAKHSASESLSALPRIQSQKNMTTSNPEINSLLLNQTPNCATTTTQNQNGASNADIRTLETSETSEYLYL